MTNTNEKSVTSLDMWRKAMEAETPAITQGAKVRIVKGCKAFDLPKGILAQVIQVKELGPEFNYNVSVTLKFLNGFKSGQTKTLQARHPNRLKDACVRLSHANPTQFIEIVRA